MAPFVVGNVLKDDFADIWKNKIEFAWNDERVVQFISDFDQYDINHENINYVMNDILL